MRIYDSMAEKEKALPRTPTPDELAQALAGIEEATEAEEWEREKHGLPQEAPVLRRVPRNEAEAGVNRIVPEKDVDFAGYVKKWKETNSLYAPHNLDINKVTFENMSDIDIPFEFVDYLMGKVMAFMKEKRLKLGDITVVRVNSPQKDMLNLLVKDVVRFGEIGTSIFSFETKPPFDLKKVQSHLGHYNLS